MSSAATLHRVKLGHLENARKLRPRSQAWLADTFISVTRHTFGSLEADLQVENWVRYFDEHYAATEYNRDIAVRNE